MRHLITRKRPSDESVLFPMLTVQRGVNRLFDDFFSDVDFPALGTKQAFLPSLDISEDDKELTIKAELPGLDDKDISIDITGNILTLSGEKKEEIKDEKKNYHRIECRYGAFERRIELPEYVDIDKVKAVFDKGLLTIAIPKKDEVKPKKITVQVGKK